MRHFKFYLSMLAVSALLFTSCSKDDPADPDPGPEEPQMVTLAFNGALQQFNKAMATKQQEQSQNVPQCKEDATPAYVIVGIEEDANNDGEGDGTWITGGPIRVNVIPVATDSGSYLTFESADLELEEGHYTLEYFAVYNIADQLIWLAPRENEDYGPANFENFVEDPLPILIDLQEGTKHYVDVEVLCYDEAEARQYGYLFFEFEQVPITYLCVFANICDDEGRHYPGEIHIKVWDYDGAVPGVYNEDNLLVDITNNEEPDDPEGSEDLIRNEDGTVYYAEPVCFPLPDPEGTNLYHIEVWSVDGPGMPGETLIYSNELTDEEVKSFLEDSSTENPEGLENYLHLRYGNYCNPPSDDPFPCEVELSCIYDDFESGDFSDYTGTEYHEFDPSDPYGGYLITDDASDYYPDFDSSPYDGNMLVLDGAPEEGVKAYYTMEAEACPGDYIFVTMDLKDLSVPEGTPRTKLMIQYTSAGTTYEVADFKIVDLNDNAHGDGWKTIGFWIKADSDGLIKLEVLDSETSEGGNDFAIDNVQICNYNICVGEYINFLNGDELD